ncbi:MAG: hypothetical protein VB912_12775, partial [Pirellulaceae bacterium]
AACGVGGFSAGFSEALVTAGSDVEAVSFLQPMESRDQAASTTSSILREPLGLERRCARLGDQHRRASIRGGFIMLFNPLNV